MFILCFSSNGNVLYLYMATSAACSSTLVMRMLGYTGCVATVRVLPYPALSGFVLSGLQLAVWKKSFRECFKC